ncbi:MAG: hypothetical protein J3T61_04975 [Candidatus Brocadiales bacterium]|nr:hypothetical protein [Candidatus Bathyanammoxibius sp.]
MKTLQTKHGDVLFLFHKLQYDFKKELPLAIGPDVYLDMTPQDVLDEASRLLEDNSICPAFCLTSYGGIMNLCLRNPAGKILSPKFNSSNLFFLSITSLRLRAPLEINAMMQLKLGVREKLIESSELFPLMSTYNPDVYASYSSEDIHICEEITKRQIHIDEGEFKRLLSALVLFSQVTCGLSKSFQMSYLVLFVALESLFLSKEDYSKAKILASRVAKFLAKFNFFLPCENPKKAVILKEWLENEYANGRNDLVHGIQDVALSTKCRKRQAQAFGLLHEITRLCILGFLSLENDKLALHSNSSGNQLQRWLDSLDPATGRFLKDQRMWCD